MPPLDHLVYAAPDLDAACAELAVKLGVRPVAGGRHPGIGTRNALIGLGSGAYLEVIGPDPDQPAPTSPRPFGIDGLSRARLAGWAVRPESLDDAVAAARAAGFDPGPTFDMRREAPDGTELRWRLTVAAPELGGVVPFLIDWGDTHHHPAATAPAGATVAGTPTITHPDPDRVAAALEALDVDALVLGGDHAALAVTLSGPRRAHLLR